MKYSKYIFIAIITLALVLGCEDRSDLTAPEVPSTGTADLTKLVSVGNSLTAGYQSGALYESAQNYSYGKMIADQMATTYAQPTISDPGIGGRIEAATVIPFSTFTQPEAAGQPTNLAYAGIYNNLGVPGAFLPDLLQATSSATALDPSNVFFDIILRERGTVLDSVTTAEYSAKTRAREQSLRRWRSD